MGPASCFVITAVCINVIELMQTFIFQYFVLALSRGLIAQTTSKNFANLSLALAKEAFKYYVSIFSKILNPPPCQKNCLKWLPISLL